MKIYTKTGDDGTTSLLGGTRVPKSDFRLECFGTIDELNSYLGLICDCYENKAVVQQLRNIQNNLFTICTDLVNEKDKNTISISESEIEKLEHEIDSITAELPQCKSFILPGGHVVSSYCQIARTVCRRAERNMIKLSETTEVNKLSTIYINRLSDYLFVLARKVLKDFNKSEILRNLPL